MDLKLRKFIARIKPLHKSLRVLAYNSGYFYYRKLYKKNKYDVFFSNIKDSKKGKKCFIIGNGPSLTVDDLNKIINIDSFAANEIHKIFSKTKFRPTYYLVMDRYTKSSPQMIRDLECKIMFLGDYYCRFNQVMREDYICLHQHYSIDDVNYKISEDISKKVNISPTVSFVAMQIAAYMGYSEIYLLGFDHNYAYEFLSNGKAVKTASKASHFFKDDNEEDIIADVIGMTRCYEIFREYAEKKGIVVKNATRGGKLEVFERVDFDSLF